jgi:hypothetical protein
MNKIDPNALAESGTDLDERPGVQIIDDQMIYNYVIEAKGMPQFSARPFSEWLYEAWYAFNEEGDKTVGQVIDGALAEWRSGR